MQILRTVVAMRHACTAARSSGKTLGLVPTMGSLHDGHLSLVRAARRQCESVAASIFVNPLQFGPAEDFDAYPRTWNSDVEMLTREGVDLLFAPSVAEMYPQGAESFVDAGSIGDRLDGVFRPGHFRGVATIVAKLFHVAGPDRAYFGQKDAAQIAVLQTMVRDLNFPLEIVVCPTVRDSDGLAFSSRNRYLRPEEREGALVLIRSLRRTEQAVRAGELSADNLLYQLRASFSSASGVRIEYAELVSPETLLPVQRVCGPTLIAVAAWVGSTRLIDNLLLDSHESAS